MIEMNYSENNIYNYNDTYNYNELNQIQKNAIQIFVNNPVDETLQTILNTIDDEGNVDDFIKFVLLPELFEYNDLRGFKIILEKYKINPLAAGIREMDADGEDWWWNVRNLFDLACDKGDENTFNYLLDVLEKLNINIWQYYTPGHGIEVGDGYISECNDYLQNRRKEELKKLKLLTSKLPGNLVTRELAEYTSLWLSQNEKNDILGIMRPPPPPKQSPPRPPPEDEYYAELREPFLTKIRLPNTSEKLQTGKKQVIRKMEISVRYDENHPHNPDYEAGIILNSDNILTRKVDTVNRIVYKNDTSILFGIETEMVQIYKYNNRLYYRNLFGVTFVFPQYLELDDVWKMIQPHLIMTSHNNKIIGGKEYDSYYLKVNGFNDYRFTVFDVQPVLNYITAEEGLKNSRLPRNVVRYISMGDPTKESSITKKGIKRYENIQTRKYNSKLRRNKQAENQRKKAKEKQKYTRKRK